MAEESPKNDLRLPDLPPELAKPKESAELLAAVADAEKAIGNLTKKRQNASETQRDLAMTYVAIAAVATHEANPDSESLQSLLSGLLTSPLLKDLALASPQWWHFGTRPNDGILIVGQTDAEGANVSIVGKSDAVSVPISPAGIAAPKSSRIIALGLITGEGDDVAVQLRSVTPLK